MPPKNSNPPIRKEPKDSWPHKKLWQSVRDALASLPAYFRSDTFIEGISATDIFTLNSALGATIENQVVEALNSIRTVWDSMDSYRTYVFVRQPQSFPDVILKNLADETEAPLLGIELKGWYLLAKEGEPSMRFTQSEASCADADFIMVVPWVLSSVISGRPKIFSPYIESAKYAAQYRNYHWTHLRNTKSQNGVVSPKNAHPYPKKSEATTDTPQSDKGGNFGRFARTGIMDEYLSNMKVQPICGIRAEYWLEFFKIFHQDASDSEIHNALSRLKIRASEMSEIPKRKELLHVLESLELFCNGL